MMDDKAERGGVRTDCAKTAYRSNRSAVPIESELNEQAAPKRAGAAGGQLKGTPLLVASSLYTKYRVGLRVGRLRVAGPCMHLPHYSLEMSDETR